MSVFPSPAPRAPAIILVAPQLGVNIGAAARVMANFSLFDLRLVAPRDGWPNPAAETMAAGAFDAGVTVRLYDDLAAAAADCHYLLAATARPRRLTAPVFDPAAAVAAMSAVSGGAAMAFGPENAGLTNDAVSLCAGIMQVPVDSGFPSLNLAQAVCVFVYQWACRESRPEEAAMVSELVPARQDERLAMADDMQAVLTDAGYFFPPDREETMKVTMRSTFMNVGWTSQQVRSFRGMIRALRRSGA